MCIFFKKFLFLLALLFILSSCEKNCIEADDFDEYEYHILDVDSIESHSCDWVDGGEFECADSTSVTANTKWIAHNGAEEGFPSDGNLNILSENSSFSMQALGTINILNHFNDSLYLSVDSNKTIFEDYYFKQSINFSLSGKWCMDGNVDNCNVNNMVGEFQDINNFQSRGDFLRRGVLVLRSLPDTGSIDNLNNYTGPLKSPNFETWNCSFGSVGLGVNETTDYTCSQGYDFLQFKSEEDRDKSEELYPIEYSFVKNIGGSVIPKNNIAHITPEVPFTETYCETDSGFIASSSRKCYTDSGKSTELSPFNIQQLEDKTTKERRSMNSFLLSSDALTAEFVYPTRLALKIVGENDISGQCSATIEVAENNSDNFQYLGLLNITANNKWYTLGDKILAPDNHYTLKEDGLGEVDFNEFYKVRISFDSNDIWKDEDGNEIPCGESVVAFFIPQNEILVKKSGFLSFNNLIAQSSTFGCNFATPDSKYQCIDSSNINLEFDIINPMYENNNINTISKNFYENSMNNNPIKNYINIPLNRSGWVGNTYVRNGQILRFSDNNWYNIQYNSEDGSTTIQNKIIVVNNGIKKNISHLPFMKIEERLALFCNGYEIENYTDYYETENTGLLMEVDGASNVIQCYDLENYSGAFRNLFDYTSTSSKCSDANVCGALSEEDVNLGAKKLQNIFANENYGNFSNFEFLLESDSLENKIYNYNGTLNIPEIKQVGLMVIDNSDFSFDDSKSYNNSGNYILNFSSSEYEINGEQLAVILADKNWKESDGFDSPLFYNWIVKYDTNNQSYNNFNYGKISSSTPYEFDKNGVLFKNGTSNSEVVISTENFPNLSNVSNFNDLRIFYKIIDKSEPEMYYCSKDGKVGAKVSKVFCKCSDKPDTNYKDCSIQEECNDGTEVEYKEFEVCVDSYMNNTGSYEIQTKFNQDLKTANAASFLNYFIKPALGLLDGNIVKLKVDTDGNPIQCQESGYDEVAYYDIINPDNLYTDEEMKNCVTNGGNFGACFLISTASIPKTQNCSLYYKDQYYKNPTGDNCGVTENYYEYTPGSFKEKDIPICYENCNSIGSSQSLKLCKSFSDGSGFTEKFYKAVITDTTYQTIVRVCFALSFSFYGLYFLLGLANLTASDLIKRAIKFSFIYLMITESGWDIYNQFFVTFFKEGIDYILFSVAGAFNDDSILHSSIQLGEFNDKTILFTPLESLFQLMISTPVSRKIWSLFSLGLLTGIIYITLVYISFFFLLSAIGTTILLYVTAQVFISLLLSFGPIFFVLLIFDKTKGMFDKWLSNLISYSLAQIFLITVATLFSSLAIESIKALFYYKICGLTIQGEDNSLSVLYSTPNIFQILFLLLLGSLMKKFVTFMNDLGGGLGGGAVSASQLSSDISRTFSDGTNAIIKGGKDLGGGALKMIGYESAENQKERQKTQKNLREGIQNASQKAKAETKKYIKENPDDFKGLTDTQKNEKIKSIYSKNYDKFLEGNKDARWAMKDLNYTLDDTKDKSYANDLYESSSLGGFLYSLAQKKRKGLFYDLDGVSKENK